LRQKYRQPARDLSGGQQQTLALAQAFVPSRGSCCATSRRWALAQAILPPILDLLRAWASEGTSIVVVEQYVDIALSIATRAIVMENGEVVLSGTASELAADPRVRDV